MTIPLHDIVTDDGRVIDFKTYPENTGYNIRAGSQELAYRFATTVTEHDRQVAAAMHRRLVTRRLWRLALDILATPTPRQRQPW